MDAVEQIAKEVAWGRSTFDSSAPCTSNVADDHASKLEIIGSPLMPEGFVGLRSDDGMTIFGPRGVYYLDARDLTFGRPSKARERSASAARAGPRHGALGT